MLSISPSASSALEQAASGSSPERSAPIAQARASEARSVSYTHLINADTEAVNTLLNALFKRFFILQILSVFVNQWIIRYHCTMFYLYCQ